MGGLFILACSEYRYPCVTWHVTNTLNCKPQAKLCSNSLESYHNTERTSLTPEGFFANLHITVIYCTLYTRLSTKTSGQARAEHDQSLIKPRSILVSRTCLQKGLFRVLFFDSFGIKTVLNIIYDLLYEGRRRCNLKKFSDQAFACKVDSTWRRINCY